MKSNHWTGVGLAVLALAAVVLLVSLGSNPTVAQDRANRDMRALLDGLAARGASVTILFDRPLVSGEGVWTLPDEATGRTIASVGADHVCFTEPWNNTRRERCTPFANITSVSYLTP